MKIVWIVLIAIVVLLVGSFNFSSDIIGTCKDNPFLEEEFNASPIKKNILRQIHEFLFKLKNGDCKGRL